jgi:hypothetical protein
MTLTNVQIPLNTDQILFRVAHVGSGDPPSIFVACPHLTEGLAATTAGDIFDQLYDDAVSNHAPGRIVWEDESGGLPGGVFLTLDFSASVDSASAAWTDSQLSLTAKRGWSYGRVLDEIIRLGYEARIVPAATDGQWKLQLFNPGTLGTDHTGDDWIGIRVGREVTRKSLRRFIPQATSITVESGNQGFSTRTDTNAVSALGRLERYIPDRDLSTLTETGLAATSLLAQTLAKGRSLQPVVVPGPDDPTPFIDYTAGDTVSISDPDEGLTVDGRIVALSYVRVDDQLSFEPALSAETFVGQAAIAQGVRQLLSAQDAIRREPPSEATERRGRLAV